MRQHDDRVRSSPPIARLAAMCLLLAATGLRGPPASAQASTAPLAIAWSRYQLPNGLDVVLAPVDTATEVSIEWWVHVGARHEAPGRFGLAHFFEHAMPFGQGVIRTRLGRQLFDSMRTNSNALTRFDYTRYYTQARAEAIDLFLLAAADRLRADPTLELTPERINAHRRNVLSEIDRAAGGTWGWPIKSRLNAGTFGPNHPYGHHTYGSDVETRETSADDMLRWFRAHIRPEYTTLIVVGRFDTVAVRSSIERTFGGMTGGTRPARATPSVPVTAPSADSVTIVSDRSHAFLSWAVPHWASDERAPLTLLARVLTERMAANRPPSVEEAKADAEFWELAGRFGVRATFSSEPDRRTIETWLRREVARLLAADVTERELRIARQAEINDIREQMMALGWENSRSELLGEGVIFADDPGAYLLELARQNTVTPNDARRTALRWLAGPGFFLVVRGAARK